MTARVRFREELARRGVSAYRIVQETAGRVSANTIYGLARPGVKRVDLETLAEVAAALERVSGLPVSISDLLELPGPTTDEELAWLEHAALDLGDRLAELERAVPEHELRAWFAAFDGAGTPVEFDPSTGEWREVVPAGPGWTR